MNEMYLGREGRAAGAEREASDVVVPGEVDCVGDDFLSIPRKHEWNSWRLIIENEGGSIG